ncbi:MAG: tyrosine-type recombinase/integrase [Pseudomonas sp.]
MATHLVQKPGESTWYVRIAVPVDVRHAFGGRSKLIKTTGTSNKGEAMDRRLPILAQWKNEIAQARANKAADRDLWREDVAQGGHWIRTRRDASILEAINNPPPPPTVVPRSRDEAEALLTGYADQIYAMLDELKPFEQAGAKGLREAIVTHLNGVTNPTPIDQVQFTAAASQRVMVQLTQHKHGLTPSELVEASNIVVKPESYKPVSPITLARLKAFRAHRKSANVADKTIDQQESKLDKLSTYLGMQGKPLDRTTVAEWLETLPLTSKTKAQYLLAGATFWKWAIKHDARWRDDFAAKDNPFTGQELPKVRVKAKAEASRRAFTPEEIERIYAAAKLSGNDTLCDLILLGSHTGCRIEELAQLRTDSVITVEGIRSLKIADSKTVAGIREIPIHPSLIANVDRLVSKSIDGFLLPSSAGNKYGIRSDSLSKAFGRLKTAQGFGKQHVFHSVRAMVVTLLLRSGVPGPTVANIVGHETGLVTFDVYDEGASPRQKLDALSNLSFTFS